jgi:DNA polymerase/3'-5' exonuclease PolX
VIKSEKAKTGGTQRKKTYIWDVDMKTSRENTQKTEAKMIG